MNREPKEVNPKPVKHQKLELSRPKPQSLKSNALNPKALDTSANPPQSVELCLSPGSGLDAPGNYAPRQATGFLCFPTSTNVMG